MRYKVKETNLTKLKKYIEVIKKQVSDKKEKNDKS
jgi:hypothetical protein